MKSMLFLVILGATLEFYPAQAAGGPTDPQTCIERLVAHFDLIPGRGVGRRWQGHDFEGRRCTVELALESDELARVKLRLGAEHPMQLEIGPTADLDQGRIEKCDPASDRLELITQTALKVIWGSKTRTEIIFFRTETGLVVKSVERVACVGGACQATMRGAVCKLIQVR